MQIIGKCISGTDIQKVSKSKYIDTQEGINVDVNECRTNEVLLIKRRQAEVT